MPPTVFPSPDRKSLNLALLIASIAGQNGWNHSKLSQGWISTLTTAEQVRQVYGYTFPLNNSTAAKICQDKVMTSALLKEAGIPQIRHKLLSVSEPAKPLWATALEFVKRYGFPLVLKPVEGSKGEGVETCEFRKRVGPCHSETISRGYHGLSL